MRDEALILVAFNSILPPISGIAILFSFKFNSFSRVKPIPVGPFLNDGI